MGAEPHDDRTSGRRSRIDRAAADLRRAIERTVRTRPALAERAARLSAGYRDGGPAAEAPKQLDAATVDAYAATRMPATFAAAAAALSAAADLAPGFAPATLLDVGAGTGATSWAATAVWPSIGNVRLVEPQRAMADLGRRLLTATARDTATAWTWEEAAADRVPDRADIVVGAYLLSELVSDSRDHVVDALWAAATAMLVLVEPGSRAGYRHVLAARDRLLPAGARVIAPCPGPEPCPIAASKTEWCHFLARLDRSPLHRRVKMATRSWEDEPFSYVVLVRPDVVAGGPAPRIVLGRPRHQPGRVELRVCADGRIERRVVSRREGSAWRTARDLLWGDALPVAMRTGD